MLGRRLTGARSVSRLLREAADAPGRRVLALLCGAPDGEPALLVCDPVVLPLALRVVPLATPLPHALRDAAVPLGLQAHGRLDPGEPVVCTLPAVGGDAVLVPAGEVFEPDPEDLLWLLDVEAALVAEHDDGGRDGTHRDGTGRDGTLGA